MPTTPNCANSSTAPVASMVVWEDASARKSGRLNTPEMIDSAKMNAAVAVRNSNPTKAAVFLLDVLNSLVCMVDVSVLGAVKADMWISLNCECTAREAVVLSMDGFRSGPEMPAQQAQ